MWKDISTSISSSISISVCLYQSIGSGGKQAVEGVKESDWAAWFKCHLWGWSYYLISEEPQLGIITKLGKLLLVTCHFKKNNFFPTILNSNADCVQVDPVFVRSSLDLDFLINWSRGKVGVPVVRQFPRSRWLAIPLVHTIKEHSVLSSLNIFSKCILFFLLLSFKLECTPLTLLKYYLYLVKIMD